MKSLSFTPKAILFDLDGVLIETEFETFTYYQKLIADQYDILIPNETFQLKIGRKSIDFFNSILTADQLKKINITGLTEQKRRDFQANLKRYVKPVPHHREVVATLAQTFPLALVSQNERVMIDRVLDWLKLQEFFSCVLSLQDITRKKPDPEIYLLAAGRLKILPEACLVIEDSLDGIAAAKNAKMTCLALAHPYTPLSHLIRADQIIHSLQELLSFSSNKKG